MLWRRGNPEWVTGLRDSAAREIWLEERNADGDPLDHETIRFAATATVRGMSGAEMWR